MNMIKRYLKEDHIQDKLVPFLSVLLGFAIGAIILAFSGYNPLEAYWQLLVGAFKDPRRIGNTLLAITPLILTGLSVAFAFRTGLFNIGTAGQMLIGGFVGTYIGIIFELPRYIHLPLAVICATLAGAIWAFIPGLLKAKFNVHEVVSTIMMNWIAVWSVKYFTQTYLRGAYDTESRKIAKTASLRVEELSKLFDNSYVNLGLFIALIAILVIWIILEKTTFGYELKAVGYNRHAAKYAGIKVNRNIILSMMISGALGGLAGATYYLGHTQSLVVGILPSLGFDGIAVALLGLNTPLGVFLSAGLFGIMNTGKGFMQNNTDVPNELVPIIIGVIIFFAATNVMIKGILKKIVSDSKNKKISDSKNVDNGGEK